MKVKKCYSIMEETALKIARLARQHGLHMGQMIDKLVREAKEKQ